MELVGALDERRQGGRRMRGRAVTKYRYRCSSCGARFTSPHPLERCLAIPKGRPCKAELPPAKVVKK